MFCLCVAQSLPTPRIAAALLDYQVDAHATMHGVVLPHFVADVAARGRLGRDGVFVDVGSGMGNVVLQVVPFTCTHLHIHTHASGRPCMRVDWHHV